MWHCPVMLSEVIRGLAIRRDGRYLDVTCGGGGHSAAILAKLGPKGRLDSFDRDREARDETKKRLESVESLGSYAIHDASFSSLAAVLESEGIDGFDGLLADFGVSSHQIDEARRGFSFQQDGPLDMRMDQTRGITAAEWLADVAETDLIRTLKMYGEEPFATSIARAIVKAREQAPITTTAQLSDLIAGAVPPRARRKKHPAKRSFQAIRMAVNHELDEIEALLDLIPRRARDGTRIVILTFHSLEDRLVKQIFAEWEHPCTCPPDFPICTCGLKPLGRRVNRRPITATDKEIAENPRARSAKLRIFEFGGHV